MVGEATAIRQAAASIPPQDTSAMDDLVEQYSRAKDKNSADTGGRRDQRGNNGGNGRP